MSRKYAGIDLHTSTTSQVAVRDEEGELLFDPMSVRTEPEPLLTALNAIQGDVEVIFEAGTGSAWLKQLLNPHVERVVVCHGADNVRNRGNKTDKTDAKDLSKRLWLGDYTEVYQGPEVQSDLNEVTRRYRRTIEQVVRIKNQIKSVYRGQGIQCSSAAVYDEKHRDEWLDRLEDQAVKCSVRQLLEQLDLFEAQRETNETALIREARARDGFEYVCSLPGFGKIRTAKAMGIIGTPYRFPGKRQLWRYSCLAVVVHDSSQWVSKGVDGPVRHHEQVTRGLNTDGNSTLKEVFRSAADTAINSYPEVAEDFDVRCTDKSPGKAKLDIARKLASQLLTVWKRKEEYDPAKARWKSFSSED